MPWGIHLSASAEEHGRKRMDECEVGPSEARLAAWSTPHGRDESLRVRTYSTGQAKEGGSANFVEKMKDTRV